MTTTLHFARVAHHWTRPLAAVLQTAAYRTNNLSSERTTMFFGTLFHVKFAISVVHGIVQEFPFGVGWSRYSVFVSRLRTMLIGIHDQQSKPVVTIVTRTWSCASLVQKFS